MEGVRKHVGLGGGGSYQGWGTGGEWEGAGD